jgi:ABC-2 type transport system ATP-binding protein
MGENNMIEVEHLTKNYGQISAISDVSFTVERGEVLGFLGPNGAGKTTTMRILTCFIPATSGSARVAGYDVFTQSLDVRRRIGYLPERVPLYGEMKVDAYLGFVAGVKGVPSRERKRKVEEVKERCAIQEISGRLVGKLSRGYAQRVGIAQALLNDPEVLILDEPTVGLDPNQIVEIRNLIKNLAGKRTIILSTHILPEVSMICDSVAIINHGRIVARDSISNLSANRQMKLTLVVRGPGEEILKTLTAVQGVESAETVGTEDNGARVRVILRPETDVREQLSAEIIRKGWGLIELRPERANLEEIFLQTTAKEVEAGL